MFCLQNLNSWSIMNSRDASGNQRRKEAGLNILDFRNIYRENKVPVSSL